MRSLPIPKSSSFMAVAATLSIPLLLAACGGTNNPAAPRPNDLVLSDAILTVDGQVMNGLTVHQSHGNGMSTRFEATLWQGTARATGATVRMRYQRPGGMGMMGSSGVITLYDDGTHGDHHPGDGIYCFEDWQDRYGCHGPDAPMGEYHYEFWGEDHMGHESNHMSVNVTVAP